MIPILYDKSGTNKLGDLNDILDDSSYVEEARNGIFELTLDYPNDYPLADQLIEENFIEVKPNDKQSPQKFRIYDTKKLMENVITVFARHESFDLFNDHVESVNLENASCEYALNTLFRNSHFSQSYRGYSDIVNAQNFKIDNVNILSAIAGKEGSIIDTYGTGAEILRDGKNIHVLNKRGHDNGVTIEYGKNLTGFELDIDLTGLETRCSGFAKYRPEGSQEDVIVKSDWIDSPFIDNFAHPYISVDGRRDYSDKFKDGEIPTKEKLNKLCQDEFKINKRDIPASNYKINFIPLSKCVGYEGVNDEISLCDIATIIDPRFNINTKSKVISYKYDFVRERYISMELGEPRTTLGDIIGGSGNSEGQVGPPGPQGPPGADGNIGDFPDNLPNTPILSHKLYGFSSIELSWTYEQQVYYQYELYASKTNNFTPNTFDLIHKGQTSSFLFQAQPNETWYFKVCCVNTHGNRTAFSSQVTVTTTKIDDLSNYVDNMAIGEALIGELNLGRGWFGQLKGNYIDAKQLSVTDGNGKRTLDIDSFGNVTLDVTELKINSKNVAQTEWVESKIDIVNDNINAQVERIEKSGVTNIIPYSYFKNPDIIKKYWYLNGVTWFEHEGIIGIQNEYPADGNVISSAGIVRDRTVSLYTDLTVESSITAKVYLIGSTTNELRYDWTLDCISYTKNESGSKKLEGIIVPSNIKTLYIQIANLGEGTTTNNVVWINRINLVEGTIAKSGDLVDVQQLSQLIIDTDGIRTEVSKKVDGNKIISTINQSAEEVTIDADKINLNGYVTMTNLGTPGQTIINGQNIKTGHIEGISLSACYLQGKTMVYIEDNGVLSCDGKTYIRDFYVPNTHSAWGPESRGSFAVEPPAYFENDIHVTGEVYTGGIGVVRREQGALFQVDQLGVQNTGGPFWLKILAYKSNRAFGVDLWECDATLKDNIVNLNQKVRTVNTHNTDSRIGLDLINSMNHYSYVYKEDSRNETIECGYIAQQLKEVNPGLVREVPQQDGNILLEPRASMIIPHLSKAIQQQDEKIKKLEERIAKLEQLLSKVGE